MKLLTRLQSLLTGRRRGHAEKTIPLKLLARLQAPGPKRMLGIDGGGIRGVMSLEMLGRIERILRERHGRPYMRLAWRTIST